MAMTRTFTSGPLGTSHGTLLGAADGGPKHDFHLDVGNFGNMPDMQKMDTGHGPHDNSGIHNYVHPIVNKLLVEMGESSTTSPTSEMGKDELISMRRIRSARTGVSHEMKTLSATNHYLKSAEGIATYSSSNIDKMHHGHYTDDWCRLFGVQTNQLEIANIMEYGSQWSMGNFNIGRRSEVVDYWRVTDAFDGIQTREGSRVHSVLTLFEYDPEHDKLGSIFGSSHKDMKFDRESSSFHPLVWQEVPYSCMSVSGPPKQMYYNSSFLGQNLPIGTYAESYITSNTASRDTVSDEARLAIFPPNTTNWRQVYKECIKHIGRGTVYLKN